MARPTIYLFIRIKADIAAARSVFLDSLARQFAFCLLDKVVGKGYQKLLLLPVR